MDVLFTDDQMLSCCYSESKWNKNTPLPQESIILLESEYYNKARQCTINLYTYLNLEYIGKKFGKGTILKQGHTKPVNVQNQKWSKKVRNRKKIDHYQQYMGRHIYYRIIVLNIKISQFLRRTCLRSS